jgi:TolA-binding protein
MKNKALLSVAAAFLIASSSASLASTQTAAKPATHKQTHTQPAAKVAPVDEYFGKMKLSPLGINNTIHDTNLRVKYDQANGGRYFQSLEWAEDALHDWARKYPQDSWLPGRAYFMSHVFWEMHTAQADAAADRCRSLLFKQFAKSRWAAMAKHETKEKVAPVVSTTTSVQKP